MTARQNLIRGLDEYVIADHLLTWYPPHDGPVQVVGQLPPFATVADIIRLLEQHVKRSNVECARDGCQILTPMIGTRFARYCSRQCQLAARCR